MREGRRGREEGREREEGRRREEEKDSLIQSKTSVRWTIRLGFLFVRELELQVATMVCTKDNHFSWISSCSNPANLIGLLSYSSRDVLEEEWLLIAKLFPISVSGNKVDCKLFTQLQQHRHP